MIWILTRFISVFLKVNGRKRAKDDATQSNDELILFWGIR